MLMAIEDKSLWEKIIESYCIALYETMLSAFSKVMLEIVVVALCHYCACFERQI